MYTARLNTVKNKYNSVSSNPLMETTKNLGNLQTDLSHEQSKYNNYISQNRSLSTQLLGIQNNLKSAQANLNTLQSKLTAQQSSVAKVQSYLSDYQESNQPSTQAVSNEELTKQLIGDLTPLNLG